MMRALLKKKHVCPNEDRNKTFFYHFLSCLYSCTALLYDFSTICDSLIASIKNLSSVLSVAL